MSTRKSLGPVWPLRVAVLAFLVALVPPGLSAQADAMAVSSSELQSAQASSVTFVNYEGPVARIDSAAEIQAIGTGLGQAMVPSASAPVSQQGAKRAGDLSRYAVLRLVDPSVKTGLEADVLILGADAQVDHIKNLRRIVAGYLSSAWGYSAKDAATLAVFVTVYNAVHRGDLAYFAGRYKPAVAKEFKAETIGLSLTYSDWPGKSAIVVPLTRGAKPGTLGAVDTGAVSDKAVTDSLKGAPGQGLGDRQALTELKDKEAVQRQADAAAKQAEADKAAADLAKKQADLAKAQADLAAAKAGAPASAQAPGTPETPPSGSPTSAKAGSPQAAATAPAGQAGADQTATVAEKEKAVAEKTAAVAAAQADTAAKQEEAKAATDAAQAKQAEASQDRAAIAQDQKAAIATEVAAKAAPGTSGVYLLQALDASGALARLIYVDPATGKLLGASSLNAIHSRAYVETQDSFVAVAGKASGSGAVRLVKLAKADLGQTAESKLDLVADSPLWKVGEAFYALVQDKASAVLVRFDASLAETARCATPINPWTGLVQGPEGLIVQGAGSTFLVLSPDKLGLIKELKP